MKMSGFIFRAEPKQLRFWHILVSFDAANRVDILSEYDLEDGKPVIPTDRITPTAGKEITVLQQLFGNLGRFSETK